MSRHDRFVAFAVINARVKTIDFFLCLFGEVRGPYDLFINAGSADNGDNLFESHVHANRMTRVIIIALYRAGGQPTVNG